LKICYDSISCIDIGVSIIIFIDILLQCSIFRYMTVHTIWLAKNFSYFTLRVSNIYMLCSLCLYDFLFFFFDCYLSLSFFCSSSFFYFLFLFPFFISSLYILFHF